MTDKTEMIVNDFIPGINGSYAQKINGKWQVHGTEMALSGQRPGEFGYATAETLDKLPNDAPVYALGTIAEPGELLKPWTKQEFLDVAKDELKQSDNLAMTKSNINKMADISLDFAKDNVIYSFEKSYKDKIVDDIKKYPEEYDQLTTKGEATMKRSVNQDGLARQQKKVMKNNPLPRVKDYSLKYIDLKQLKDNSEKESDYFIGKDELNDALKEGSRYGLLISSKNTMDEETNVVHPLVKNGLNYLADLNKETLPKEIKNFTRDLAREAPDKGEGYAIVCGAGNQQMLHQATLKSKDLNQEQEMSQQQGRGLEL